MKVYAQKQNQPRQQVSPGVTVSRITVYSKAPVGLQAKLSVNSPEDIYEQEADRVADQIMRMPASKPNAVPPRIQRIPRENDHRANPARARLFSVNGIQALAEDGSDSARA